jgi:MFS family permease
MLGAILFGGTFAGVVSLMLVFIGHKFPHNPAKAMAKLTISYSVAQITVPAISGFIATVSGSYSGSLWLASLAMAIGIVFLCVVKRLEKQDSGYKA